MEIKEISGSMNTLSTIGLPVSCQAHCYVGARDLHATSSKCNDSDKGEGLGVVDDDTQCSTTPENYILLVDPDLCSPIKKNVVRHFLMLH